MWAWFHPSLTVVSLFGCIPSRTVKFTLAPSVTLMLPVGESTTLGRSLSCTVTETLALVPP